MPITATVTSPTDSLRQEVVVDHRHVVRTDEPPHLGGEDSAPTPLQLLPAAVAACVVTTMRMYARRKGWELGEITVAATFNGDVRDPVISFGVHYPEGIDEERLRRLEHVADACAVHRALERGVRFEHQTAAPAAA